MEGDEGHGYGHGREQGHGYQHGEVGSKLGRELGLDRAGLDKLRGLGEAMVTRARGVTAVLQMAGAVELQGTAQKSAQTFAFSARIPLAGPSAAGMGVGVDGRCARSGIAVLGPRGNTGQVQCEVTLLPLRQPPQLVRGPAATGSASGEQPGEQDAGRGGPGDGRSAVAASGVGGASGEDRSGAGLLSAAGMAAQDVPGVAVAAGAETGTRAAELIRH